MPSRVLSVGRLREHRARGLGGVVDESFRLVILGAALVVVLTAGLLAWIVWIARPVSSSYETGLGGLQRSETAMLDQETGLRAYLTVRDPAFLDQYAAGNARMADADAAVVVLAGRDSMAEPVVDVLVAERVWMSGWAEEAVRNPGAYPPGSARLRAFLERGAEEFAAYRAAQQHAAGLAADGLSESRQFQRGMLQKECLAAAGIGLLMLLGAVRRRKVLRRELLTPLADLLTGLDEVREGRFERRVQLTGATEMMELGNGFNRMLAGLVEGREGMARREQQMREQSANLRGILRMVREIGGSLNLRYVVASILTGVQTITSAGRVVVWLVQDDAVTLAPVGDTEPDGVREATTIELGTGVVGRAAKYGRVTTGATEEGDTTAHRAVPLIIGARVVGVLELFLAETDVLSDDQVEVLETLSIHAGAAIEAARLHQLTSHASEHDALTRLANRRRLEADLALECDRTLRYGRPLAFIMLDLDYFKRLNDTYGHARGDEVLQAVADTITMSLRSTDSAYRYGGEELAVLARESDLAGAVVLAERIRTNIEARFSGSGEGHVTASLGVAAVPDHAASPKALIAAADAALYTAKHSGRNTVCTPDPAVREQEAVAAS